MALSVFRYGGGFPSDFFVIATGSDSGVGAKIAGYKYTNGLFAEKTTTLTVTTVFFDLVSISYVQPYWTFTAQKDLTAVLPDGTKKKFKSGEVMISDWHWSDVKCMIVY